MDADSGLPVESLHDGRRSVSERTIRVSIEVMATCFTVKPNTFSTVLTEQEHVSAAEIVRSSIYLSRAESHL